MILSPVFLLTCSVDTMVKARLIIEAELRVSSQNRWRDFVAFDLKNGWMEPEGWGQRWVNCQLLYLLDNPTERGDLPYYPTEIVAYHELGSSSAPWSYGSLLGVVTNGCSAIVAQRSTSEAGGVKIDLVKHHRRRHPGAEPSLDPRTLSQWPQPSHEEQQWWGCYLLGLWWVRVQAIF